MRAARLSDRHVVIATMVARDWSCQDIASQLFLPLHVIERYVDELLVALKVPLPADVTVDLVERHCGAALWTIEAPRREQGGETQNPTPGQVKPPLETISSERPTSLPLVPLISGLSSLRTPSSSGPGDSGPDGPDSRDEVEHMGVTVKMSALHVLDELEAVQEEAEAFISRNHRAAEMDRTGQLLMQVQRIITELEQSLSSCEVIAQATGILMERHKISAATALEALENESRHHHRELVRIAEMLIHAGHAGGRMPGTAPAEPVSACPYDRETIEGAR